MIEIFITWLILVVVFCGVGSLAARKLDHSDHMTERWFAHFWVGWCLVIGFLQIWHFFFKINALVFLPIGIAALIGLVLSAKELFLWVRSSHLSTAIIFASLTGFFGLWLANRALVPAQLYDAALYHMQTVMWNSAYPIVPGLGNLHFRFAFNNSSFLYSAMTEILLWNQRSYHIGNSVFIFVLLMQSLVGCYRLITDPRKRPVNLFMTLMFFPAVITAYDVFYVSYSPDLPIFVLGIVLSAHLLTILFNATSIQNVRLHAFMIILLSFTGITIKLSFVGFAAPALIITFLIWIFNRQPILKMLVWSALAGIFYLLPWTIRSVLLSGYLVFPLTVGAFPVEWRIPEYRVIDAREWIQSWARMPYQHWGNVNFSNEWIVGWVQQIPETITTPLLILLFFMILAAFLSMRNKNASFWKRGLFLIAPLVSLVFWFINAPDDRFAGAAFWVLAFGAVALAFSFVDDPEKDPMALRAVAILGLISMIILPIPGPILVPHARLQAAPAEFEILSANFQTAITKSGLSLHLPPPRSEQCWKIPIPCAAAFDPYLGLINEHDIAKGFKIDPQMPYPVPDGFAASPKVAIEIVSGWYPYEKETRQRWMASPSQFLFYADHSGVLKLSLTPGVINNENGPGTSGEVKVRIDKKYEKIANLRSQRNTVVHFSIAEGFHLIELINEQGNFYQKEMNSDNEEEQPHSIRFSEVRIEVVR